VALHWRVADGPWQALPASSAAPFTLCAALPPQPAGTTLWYAFATAAGHAHGTPAAPHRLFVHDQNWRPALTVTAPAVWPIGQDLPLTLYLASPGGVRAAWLYYRRQHQAEDWLAIALPPLAGPATATIPGAYLDGSYDLQLTAAVVDHADTATWWPDPASHDPLHLVRLTT
jgi:hypothetical protein